MKSSKKILSVLLVLMFVVGLLAGCASNGSGTPSGDTGTPTATPAGSTGSGDKSGDTDTNEPEKGGVRKLEPLRTLSLFNYEVWWNYTTWEGAIPEYITDKTGVTLQVSIAADANQINLMVASGDCGDLLCAGNWSTIANSNVCYDFDSLMEEHNIYFPIHSCRRFVNQSADGKLYTIFCAYGPESEFEEYPLTGVEGGWCMWRKDIWEEMGSPDVSTFQDIYNMFDYVKEHYPTMHLAMYSHTHTWMKTQCNTTNWDFVDIDGQGKWWTRLPGTLTFYKEVNYWYRNGYYTMEDIAGTTKASELQLAGDLFLSCGYCTGAEGANKRIADNGGTFSYMQQPKALTDYDATFYYCAVGWRGLYVPLSCSDTEAAINFCAFMYDRSDTGGMYTALWGIYGEDWTWSDDHQYPVMNWDFANPDTTRQIKYWGWMTHDAATNILPYFQTECESGIAISAITKIVDFNPVVGMIRLDADSDENILVAKLKDLEAAFWNDIATAPSAEQCEAKFHEMVAQEEAMGLNELEDFVNETYASNKVAFEAIRYNKE